MPTLLVVLVSVGVGAIVGLLMSAVPINRKETFLIWTPFAALFGAIAAGIIYGTALDTAFAGNPEAGNLAGALCLTAGAFGSAGVAYLIGRDWGRRIRQQKSIAPATILFLSRNFDRLATPGRSRNEKAFITKDTLEKAVTWFSGRDLELLQEVIKHFKDIGHFDGSESVPMPPSSSLAGSLNLVNVYTIETYVITHFDVTTYQRRLDAKYPGW